MKYKIKELMRVDISKMYILGVAIICLLLIGGFFSYAMFTVSKEKSNAISIVTGNLTYKLAIDGTEGNTLTVESGETKKFTVVLSNPNNRKARFNFYYVGTLDTDVTAGYLVSDGINTPPVATGINLEQADASGSSNTYTIKVTNKSNSSKTVTLGVSVGLDYNDLSLPDNGHLFSEASTNVSDVVIDNLNSGSIYDDGEDTFITGEDPNNYIWYSGKLWRAVSVNNEAKTTKLVTQWDISTITYDDDSSAFEGSYMEDWLNDTTVDGFLCNLREPEKFIVMDSKWNATMTTENTKPSETTMVTDAVGLLNYYEYVTSYRGTDSSNGYLNNGLDWWTLTPDSSSTLYTVYDTGITYSNDSIFLRGIRPSINLKSDLKITSGDGTVDNPYRLEGDNDINLSGTLLSSRYSGEYIRFGTGENNLYRIVSHEKEGLTKITSAEPLKDSGTFKTISFGSDVAFSSANTIGTFLNGDYLTSYVGSLYTDMIEDSTTWYFGSVVTGTSYKLAKYTDITGTTLISNVTSAKVGLLRLGELMAGQFERYTTKDGESSIGLTTRYWTLSTNNLLSVRCIDPYGTVSDYNPSFEFGILPSVNLKSNVVITSGDGTKENPFELSVQ